MAIQPEIPQKQNFINGEWCDPIEGQYMDTYCPSSGKTLASLPASTGNDIDQAVEAARTAFERGAWPNLNPVQRGRLLAGLGKAIEDNINQLAELEARDTGKPLKQANADIVATARYFEFYGGAADKFGGETIPYLQDYQVQLVREPLGVTGHIIPWNYPAQMFGRTLAPALAMGNCVVFKPAEDACLTPIALTGLAHDVGFPNGSINLVSGIGDKAGSALASHQDINFLSFTGSPEVGSTVQAQASKNHISCNLELGGKSPQIVFSDADLKMALPIIVNAIIQNAGQTCSAGSRILIQESIYDEVVGKLQSRFSKLVAGPYDQNHDLGPLISLKQKERVTNYLKGVNEDLILARGEIASSASSSGYYFPPTLIGPLDPDDKLAREEIFGPVLVCIKFEDEAEAINIANGTRYGLISGVWTRDGSRQIRLSRKLNCGQVFINCYGAGGGVELPFGGTKMSGHGREKGMEALKEFSQIKTVVQYYGE